MCGCAIEYYSHYCGGYHVVMTTGKHRCPWCKRTAAQLAAARDALPVRRPSAGYGGLTGRPFTQPGAALAAEG